MSIRSIPRVACFLLLITGFSYNGMVLAQARHQLVVHRFPLDGSKEVPPTTAIGVRMSGAIDPVTLEMGHVLVTGSRSGSVPLQVRLSADRRSLVIHPKQTLQPGESVTVEVHGALVSGEVANTRFQFTASERVTAAVAKGMREELSVGANSPAEIDSANGPLPPLFVSVDNAPEPGSVYLANFPFGQGPNPYGSYLMVLDQNGVLKRDRQAPSTAIDFKPQPNGLFTFFDNATGQFYGMDSSFTIVDSFHTEIYRGDGHELLLFKDGGYMLLGQSFTNVDMSHAVVNGFNDANVIGNVTEEFDKDHNLIFVWRGIDYYNPADAVHEDLTKTTIDFEHANSLSIDLDSNIILSNRHLSEITKINRSTGEIMWRMGGVHNEFKFIGDTFDSIPFSYQHDARILPNGHMTVFDNGNFHRDTVSRALEFAIDTAARTATLVWQYRHTPDVYTMAMGNVERLANGNTLIGWGSNVSHTATEVRPDGTVAFELSMADRAVSYRVFKAEGLPRSVAPDVAVGGLSLRIYATDAPGFIGYSYSAAGVEGATVSVYDAVGRIERVVERTVISSEGEHFNVMDLRGLSAGSHFCVLTVGAKTVAQGFVLNK